MHARRDAHGQRVATRPMQHRVGRRACDELRTVLTVRAHHDEISFQLVSQRMDGGRRPAMKHMHRVTLHRITRRQIDEPGLLQRLCGLIHREQTHYVADR